MADDKTRDGAPVAKADAPEPTTDTAPTKRSRKATPSEPVARAGGYVDRGDGNGWVLEEE